MGSFSVKEGLKTKYKGAFQAKECTCAQTQAREKAWHGPGYVRKEFRMPGTPS